MYFLNISSDIWHTDPAHSGRPMVLLFEIKILKREYSKLSLIGVTLKLFLFEVIPSFHFTPFDGRQWYRTVSHEVDEMVKSPVVFQKVFSANWKYWLLFSSSTTFLAHLFCKNDSFLLFFSSRACAATTEGSKTARKNQFCQRNVRGKLLKDDPNFADNTFCNATAAMWV